MSQPIDILGKAQLAYDHLKQHIADGRWRPGEQLPTERHLAQSLGLARNTVRRALDILEDEGLIARGVGRGTFLVGLVGPAAALPSERFHNASPAQIMELRLLLEPAIAEWAVGRATPKDLADLDRCLVECEAAGSVGAFEFWDGELHRLIVAACHNDLLDAVYTDINAVRSRAEWGYLKQRSLTPERRAKYEEHHRQIVAALKARDPKAAREAVHRHLMAVRDALFPT